MRLAALSRRSLGLLAVGLPLLALFVYVVLRSGPMAPIRVTATEVEQRAITPQVAGIGLVEARYSHRIGPIAAGRLLSVAVQPGDEVEAGQIVAELDPVDLQQRLAALRAILDKAEAGLGELKARHALAASQAERYAQLFASGLVSAELADTRRQELRIAEAARSGGQREVARARAELEAANSQRDNLLLRSPVRGIVAARGADPGTTVVAGQSVIEVIEPDEVWISARFDQVNASGLAAGLAARVELRSRENEPIAAVVSRLEPRADAVTEEFLAKIAFVSTPDPLPALGEIVQLTVDLPTVAPAPVLPAAAIRRVGGEIGAWRIDDDQLTFVPLRLGVGDLDGQVQVLEGLQIGDRVVLYSEATLSARSRFKEVASLIGGAR